MNIFRTFLVDGNQIKTRGSSEPDTIRGTPPPSNRAGAVPWMRQSAVSALDTVTPPAGLNRAVKMRQS
jgi:hypothetical protein